MADILRRPRKQEPLLYAAARMVLAERDSMAGSSVESMRPHILYRLEAIALELERIEDSL
jgi:hypothetical protein